jgi:hypothetical protein
MALVLHLSQFAIGKSFESAREQKRASNFKTANLKARVFNV